MVYTPGEIERIRAAGREVARCRELVRRLIQPGVTTRYLDQAVAQRLREAGATSPFLHYRLARKDPFPATVCISVNEVVVHGLPNEQPLREGDLVSVDIGVQLDGFIGDSAWTFPVGKVDEPGRRLLEAGESALLAGIGAAQVGARLGEISRAIQQCTERRGFAVVREFVGHGVGRRLHEAPEVPNYVPGGALLPFVGKLRQRLCPGMVLAIEPMLNEGTAQVVSHERTWPVRTADGRRSVHFEHTVAVLEDGTEILTQL